MAHSAPILTNAEALPEILTAKELEAFLRIDVKTCLRPRPIASLGYPLWVHARPGQVYEELQPDRHAGCGCRSDSAKLWTDATPSGRLAASANHRRTG